MATLGVLLVPAQAAPAPAPNWIDDVIDVIDDIIDDLEDADDEASMAQGANLARLDAYLNQATYRIDELLDDQVYPSLDPGVAGDVDTSVSPATLADYGATTISLALDALEEAANGAYDQEFIASNLITIAHLITRESPHNYKSKAGL